MESDTEVVVIDCESSNDEPVVKIARYGDFEEVCCEKKTLCETVNGAIIIPTNANGTANNKIPLNESSNSFVILLSKNA